MEQIDFDKLAAEEQKKNEKIYRKMKWRNRFSSLFGKKPKIEDLGYVEMPVETCELSDEFLEMKEQAEKMVEGK